MVISFLPFEDFEKSVKSLDSSRLGKMRSENYIILSRIENNSLDGGGWSNHPMTRSWRGYPDSLKYYLNCVFEEWEERGFKNSFEFYSLPDVIIHPPFVGLMEFHFSHQAALVRKHPYFYSTTFTDLPGEYLSLGYLWPCTLTTEKIMWMKEERTYLNPDIDLFTEINQQQLISSEKSEFLFYSLADLIKIAEDKGISNSKKMRKRDLFSLLKEKNLLPKKL